MKVLNNLKTTKTIFYNHSCFLIWIYANFFYYFKTVYNEYKNSKYIISLVPFENDYLFTKWGINSVLMNNFINSQPHIIYTTLESINELVKQVNTNYFLATNLITKYSQNFYKTFLSLAKNTNLFDRNNNIPKLALYTLATYGTHVTLDTTNIIYNVIKSLIEMFANTLIINNFNNQK